MDPHVSQPFDLHRLLAVLRRQWIIILVAAILTPAIVVIGSSRQTPVYSSSADVLLRYDNLAGSLTGTADSTVNVDPERAAQTQAQLARVPEVARRALAAAGSASDVDAFLESSSVSSSTTSDLLTFTVKDADPGLAQRLATEYGRQFIAYRLELDTAAIARARQELQTRISQLRDAGSSETGLLATLIDKDQTLQTIQSLQTSNALLVREGDDAQKVFPTPVRNGVIGFGIGLLIGIGFAFLRETLNTSVRSPDEISERLGLTLLARLPEPPRRLRAPGRLAMLDEPTGVTAEAFRMLRTNVEFVDGRDKTRVIAVTSAVNDEGKSTTAANLAVAFARAGRRVILIDLDLRKPTLQTSFGITGHAGVTDLVLDGRSLEDTLVPIDLGGADQFSRTGLRSNGASAPPLLQVLTSGALPADAGEFVAGAGLAGLLSTLRERCDLVIVDTPPLLRVGDTMTMSVAIDGVILVARTNVVTRQMLSETIRLLRRTRTKLLGVVVTGSQTGDDYGSYGYGELAPEEATRPTFR